MVEILKLWTKEDAGSELQELRRLEIEKGERKRERGKRPSHSPVAFYLPHFLFCLLEGSWRPRGEPPSYPQNPLPLSLSLSLSLCLSVSLFATQSKGDLSSPCAAERPASRKRANRISGWLRSRQSSQGKRKPKSGGRKTLVGARKTTLY